MNEAEGSQFPVLQVESEQSPLAIGVRGREMEFLMVTEPELDGMASDQALSTVDLAFLGISAGTAGNALLALLSGAVVAQAVIAVWAVFGVSLVASAYLMLRLYFARRRMKATVARLKAGRLVSLPEEWLRRRAVPPVGS